MTNILATTIISLSTNWTGIPFQGRELGYVTTNHNVRIVYQDTTNVFEVKREASGVAVWRDQTRFFIQTNLPSPSIEWWAISNVIKFN